MNGEPSAAEVMLHEPMKAYFQGMFVYERWANGKFLTYLEEHPENEPLRKIFNHLVADALPWLYILDGKEVPETVIETINISSHWSPEECQAHLDRLQDTLDRLLASFAETDLTAILLSPGPHGRPFRNTVSEILTHLLSHGQHHRGQIEWLVEQEAGIYLGTSYMPYLRQDTLKHS